MARHSLSPLDGDDKAATQALASTHMAGSSQHQDDASSNHNSQSNPSVPGALEGHEKHERDEDDAALNNNIIPDPDSNLPAAGDVSWKPYNPSGALYIGSEKHGKTPQEIWPMVFQPLRRASFALPELQMIMHRISYKNWVENPPGIATDSVAMNARKKVLSVGIRKCLLAYCSNKLLPRLILDTFPGIPSDTIVFRNLYLYASEAYVNFRRELLLNFYHLANEWLLEFGAGRGSNFNVQAEDDATFAGVNKWMVTRLDEMTFNIIWSMVSKYVDYRATFTGESTARVYIRELFVIMMRATAELVLQERKDNPGVTWSKRVGGTEWRTNRDGRDRLRDIFESMACLDFFKDVEMDSFVWVSPTKKRALVEIENGAPMTERAMEARRKFLRR